MRKRTKKRATGVRTGRKPAKKAAQVYKKAADDPGPWVMYPASKYQTGYEY